MIFDWSVRSIGLLVPINNTLPHLVVTRPLPRDGGMVEDHGAPEAGNSLRHGPEVAERQRITKERAAQRVHCFTEQNETRGALGWLAAGPA